MRVPFDRRRDVFIHDYDGVHYRYLDHPNFFEFLVDCGNQAAIEILSQHGISLGLDEARDVHVRAYEQYGAGHYAYLPYSRRAGLTDENFISLYSKLYHRNVFIRTESESPKWLEQCSETIGVFRALQGRVRHGLLTQSDIQEWAVPKLERKGLLQFFEENCLLGFEECGLKLKSVSADPIALALERMDARADQAAFIEDSHKNLKIAKEAFPDICTILIADETPNYDYVDVHAATLRDFKRIAAKVHGLGVAPSAALTL